MKQNVVYFQSEKPKDPSSPPTHMQCNLMALVPLQYHFIISLEVLWIRSQVMMREYTTW